MTDKQSSSKENESGYLTPRGEELKWRSRQILPDFPTKILIPHGTGSTQGCILNSTSFKDLRTIPGTLFVDKTPAIARIRGGMPLLRRPAGFGKTTMLDMLIRYHDIHGSADYEQLFGDTLIGRNLGTQDWSHCLQPNQRLVLTFDLTEVDPKDIQKSRSEYVVTRLREFLHKYKHELKVDEDTINEVLEHNNPITKAMRLVRKIKRRVFLGVDNYTAPLKDGNDRSEMHAVQYYICRGFFEEISCNVHGVVDYGLVVGEDPLFPSEWSTNPSLPIWETEPWHPPGAADITWIHGTEYTIGLSRDDVTALADAYLHSSPRRLYKNIQDHCKPQRYIRTHPELITYSTERVFAVLRRRKSGDKELEQDPNADLRPCCDGLVPAPGWTREDIMAIFEGLSPEALGLPESALEQEDYTHWHCTTPSIVFRARKEIQARKKRSRKASKGGKNVKSG